MQPAVWSKSPLFVLVFMLAIGCSALPPDEDASGLGSVISARTEPASTTPRLKPDASRRVDLEARVAGEATASRPQGVGVGAPASGPQAVAAPQENSDTDTPVQDGESAAIDENVPAADEPSSEPDGPWRLETALGLPDWLEISGAQRTRYETLDSDFRVIRQGSSNQLWALRTLLKATAHVDRFRITAEGIDSRQFRAPDDAFLNTGTVNAVELLQGFVGARFDGVFADGDSLDLQLGRQTIDIGGRRLVARNNYRNTINAFTGLNGKWKNDDNQTLEAFIVMPVRRLPRRPSELDDNDVRFDEEQDETEFFGVHASSPVFNEDVTGELYFFGLDEDDESDVLTRNRELYTVGARVVRKPAAGEVNFEWESAFQWGESRSTPLPTDTEDLDHTAMFHHLSVGYQFDVRFKPLVEALFDYASGDQDSGDGDNNRFDTLFGARRFGPTGIFGAFARANLISPGLRVKFSPAANTKVMLAHRLHYLASKEDFWTTSGLRDPDGDSGRFIGQLAEIRVRHEILPKNLMLEAGYAHLFAGEFPSDAPLSDGRDDSSYAYVATTITF